MRRFQIMQFVIVLLVILCFIGSAYLLFTSGSVRFPFVSEAISPDVVDAVVEAVSDMYTEDGGVSEGVSEDLYLTLSTDIKVREEKAGIALLSYLTNKYAEDFEIIEMGIGKTVAPWHLIKGRARAVRSGAVFNVCIDEDLEYPADTYLDVILSDKLQSLVGSVFASKCNDLVYVSAHFDSGWYPSDLTNMRIGVREYFDQNWTVRGFASVFFIVPDEDLRLRTDILKLRLSQNASFLHSALSELADEGVRDADIYVYFVSIGEWLTLSDRLASMSFAARINHYASIAVARVSASITEGVFSLSASELQDAFY